MKLQLLGIFEDFELFYVFEYFWPLTHQLMAFNAHLKEAMIFLMLCILQFFLLCVYRYLRVLEHQIERPNQLKGSLSLLQLY